MTTNNINTQLKNNPPTYRSILTLPSSINFGLELELENVDIGNVCRVVSRDIGSDWLVKEDKSLKKGNNAEIVTPVLTNRIKTWKTLKKLGELLERLNPTYDNCSFQINFDGKLLPSTEDKARFFKLYAMYEDIIYRFSKGEDLYYRESLETYASPIILALKGVQTLGNNTIIDYFSDNKRYGIVYKTKHDLIEFRTPNATNNPILWQNYITTFYYLLRYATSRKCNTKELDEYINNFNRIYLLESYERLNEVKALKLSNMIFPHKQDQLQFLHQYIGKTK